MDDVRGVFAGAAMAFGLTLACVGLAWKVTGSLAWALVAGGVLALVVGAVLAQVGESAKR
jgi:hypothetical protein